MILGIHCSVVRGLPGALEEAVSLSCPAMQMLPYRRHHAPGAEETAAFKAARLASCVKRLVVHSRFVPNLGSASAERRGRSIEHLREELRLARELGAEGYVLHAAAYSPGSDVKEGIRLFVDAVAEARPAIPVWVENVPGGGRRMGGTLEEIAEIAAALTSRGLDAGVCLDTAHAWSAGYDIASAEAMLKWIARVNRVIGSGRVFAFHLNDTRALLGSRLENHWHWGQGHLRPDGLKVLLDRPEFESAVGIIETPKTPEADARNLEFVRNLASES